MAAGSRGRPESLDSYAANIVETVRQPLIVLDANLRVRFANRSFYQMFQAAPGASEGTLLYDLCEHQWDIAKLRKLLERILAEGNEVRDYEVEQLFPTIGRRTMQVSARRLCQRGQAPPLILLTIEDISNRKRAEETRRLSRAAAAHDIRNTLSNLVGYAQLLEDGEPAEAVAPRLVSLSKALGETMQDLLDGDHAENDHPALAPVSARALIRERTDAIEWRSRQKGLGFRVGLPAEGTIVTDPIKMGRILDNLLSNAIRYTPRGSVSVQGRLAPAALSVTVRDTGIGIPAEHLSRIFDQYYRAPAARRIAPLGSGLGLSTVKRFCDLLGGTARIESTPGLGTTCTVVLPRRPPPPPG